MPQQISVWRLWFLAMRPKTLPAAIAPILVAIALATASPYSVDPLLVLLALTCSFCLQVLVNFANDYSDAQSGVDTELRVGPQRVTQSGLISPSAMKKAIATTALFALATGTPLMIAGGWPIAFLGVCCILAALAYSGGPWPLASHGLGEVTVLVFFGFVAVMGGGYVLTGTLLKYSFVMALIAGLPIAAIMLVNNTRDMATDQPAGKQTLPVSIGREAANKLYTAMVLAPALIATLSVLFAKAPATWLLAVIFTLPMATKLSKRFAETQGEAFNPLLALTAKYSLINSALFSTAILIPSLV